MQSIPNIIWGSLAARPNFPESLLHQGCAEVKEGFVKTLMKQYCPELCHCVQNELCSIIYSLPFDIDCSVYTPHHRPHRAPCPSYPLPISTDHLKTDLPALPHSSDLVQSINFENVFLIFQF